VPSTLTIIQAISPTLIGLSFLIPFFYGRVGKSWLSSISLGWCLCILTALLSPFYNRIIQLETISADSSYIAEPTHPSLILTLSLGWLLPLAGYFLGKKIRAWKKTK